MALCTLDNVKAYLDMPVEKKNPETDDLLTVFIDRVSKRMETYCDRIFVSDEYTEYYDGDSRGFLYTNQYPITSVSGIWNDAAWTWDTNKLVAAADYRISNNGRRVILKTGYFENYTENIKIIYTAGYASAAIPLDLVDACIKEVAKAYKQKGDPHVTVESHPDGSSTRFATDFLPSTISVLDKYKNMDIV